MGVAHSKLGCLAVLKTSRQLSKKHRSSCSLDQFSSISRIDESALREEVVLTENDFRGANMKELQKGRPNIKHVRLTVGEKLQDGAEWIPTDIDLIQLSGFMQLESLDVKGCKEITRRGLTRFCIKPSKIRELLLDDCPKITNNFFDHIVHFCRLERLHVRGCFRISDNGVEALTTLKHLRHLDLSVCATEPSISSSHHCECPTITDAALDTLSRMTQLQSLQLEQCTGISDDGLCSLASLHNLTCLNIAKTALTDKALRVLRHFPKLISLSVNECQITELALSDELCHLPQLKHLNVAGVKNIGENFLKKIKHLQNLTQLNISDCMNISDNAFLSLNSITTIRCLKANGHCGITAGALDYLTDIQELRALHISGVNMPSATSLLRFDKLHALEIRAVSAEDDKLSKLGALQNLKELTLHLPPSDTEPASLSVRVLGVHVRLIRRAVFE